MKGHIEIYDKHFIGACLVPTLARHRDTARKDTDKHMCDISGVRRHHQGDWTKSQIAIWDSGKGQLDKGNSQFKGPEVEVFGGMF